nr:immunoglobulin heavy chain junction region [Macaca mulatta]
CTRSRGFYLQYFDYW